MAIIINDRMKIVKAPHGYSIVEKTIVKEKEIYVPILYFTNLQSAIRGAFSECYSGRKKVNIEDIDAHIKHEIALFLKSLNVDGEF